MLARELQEGEKVKREYSIKATQKVELLEVLTISFSGHASLRCAQYLLFCSIEAHRRSHHPQPHKLSSSCSRRGLAVARLYASLSNLSIE